MKILIVTHYFQPHPGGIEIVAQNQAKHLTKVGQDVLVLTSATDGIKAGAFDHEDGYKIHRISASNILERKLNVPFPLFSPRLLTQAHRLVRQADVVHIHDSFYLSSLVAAIFARLYNKPFVVTQHVDMVPHPRAFIRLAQKLAYATTGGFVLRSSARIVILNSRVKDFLISNEIDKSKIVFIPNGVDTELFTPATKKQEQELRKKYNLPKDKTLALFVGRFAPKKGFTKLLKLEPIDNLHFVFAGGDTPKNHSRKDHHFVGRIKHQDTPELYRMCDLFVLPSEGEGFPLSVQEAMASGLPVITSDDPSYVVYELNRDYIELITPSIQGIALALKMTSGDPEKRKRMSTYAKSYARTNFDWDINVKNLLKIYNRIRA